MDDDGFFPLQIRALGVKALDEVSRRGGNTVEAEHILLALTADAASTASKALAPIPLDYDAIDAALKAERARSLAVAGVGPIPGFSLATTPRRPRPVWGASTREMMSKMKRDHSRPRREHGLEIEMLIGIFSAEIGTVPRALAFAGIDREALVTRLQNI